MITEEMKSTLLDIEINNPEGIQNLKALLKNYSDIINKDQSTLSEEEEQSLCDLQDNIMILIFGPLYSQFKFEYIQSYTTMEEVLDSFTFKVGASQGKAYIESQEISFNRGGTIINKEL